MAWAMGSRHGQKLSMSYRWEKTQTRAARAIHGVKELGEEEEDMRNSEMLSLTILELANTYLYKRHTRLVERVTDYSN